MQLTKRDKTLLKVLAFVVILAIFIPLLILPQWKRYGARTDELAKKELTKQEMQTGLELLAVNQNAIEQKKVEFQTSVEKLYPIMESYEIESMITKIALDQGLFAKDFEISSRAFPSVFYPYFASGLAQELGMTSVEDAQKAASSEGQDEKTEEAAEETVGIPSQSVIYSSKIEASVSGERANMERLIDRIYTEYPAIRIVGYDISTETTLKTDDTPGKASELTLMLELYMCAK